MGRKSRRHPRWPWLCLIAAMAWVAVVRVPLVLNAEVHLDSDLAVDGLTLLEASHGHLRWHYPGTPFTGIGPLFLSLPQALAFTLAPDASQGSAAGLVDFSRGVGVVLGPLFVGVAVSGFASDLPGTHGYAVMWPMIGLPILLSLVLLRLIRKSEQSIAAS